MNEFIQNMKEWFANAFFDVMVKSRKEKGERL